MVQGNYGGRRARRQNVHIFADFREKVEKRWITGTPLEEASNIFRRLTQNQKEGAAGMAQW